MHIFDLRIKHFDGNLDLEIKMKSWAIKKKSFYAEQGLKVTITVKGKIKAIKTVKENKL